jgi:hypothetical protein
LTARPFANTLSRITGPLRRRIGLYLESVDQLWLTIDLIIQSAVDHAYAVYQINIFELL